MTATASPERARTRSAVSEGGSSQITQPIWFGDPARPCFGWFHAPTSPARDCVVVLCNPFGYDTMISHYSYRHLAERLAAGGIATLRFDYYGTGDSAGNDAAPGRVEEWLASITAACTEARRRSGAGRTALVGLRVGGLLATASGQRLPVDDLIVLGPPTSGRQCVRELRALRMLQPPVPGPDNPEGKAPEDENFGFLVTEPMRAELSALEPLKVRAAPARRALVLPRDDGTAEAALVEHLRACGVEVTASSTPWYSLALRGDPYTCDLPEAAWDEIVAWLRAAHPGPVPLPPHAAETRSADDATVTLGSIREEAVRFQGLVGLLTEPTDPSAARSRTAILLLNVGANHHIGSNRMYVTWARHWAALGFRVLRFDFSGVGDSPAIPGRPEKAVYDPNAMPETRAAMDFLSTRGCDRFVLCGLCSGGYVSFYTALEDPRAAGIILVNPPTFHWKQGDSLELKSRAGFASTNFYKKRVLKGETWRRALRGEVHVRAVFAELARRAGASAMNRAGAIGLRLGLVPERDDVARGFQQLCARGCDSLLVYGMNDGGLDVMERHLGAGARKMASSKGFRVEILDGTDHIFTPRAAQEHLKALLTTHVVARFG